MQISVFKELLCKTVRINDFYYILVVMLNQQGQQKLVNSLLNNTINTYFFCAVTLK